MKKRTISLILVVLASSLLFLSGGCAKKRAGIAPAKSLTIGIAAFYQPQSTAEMLAGYMPEGTPKVDSKIFAQLDNDLDEILRANTQRTYKGTEISYPCIQTLVNQTRETSAFAFWMSVGQCMKVDLILVPQVHAWQEREGGSMGAKRPAGVILDFFLLDVTNQSLISRSRYDETQKALSENLLDVSKFIERGGKWVSAHELAQEGMLKAVKELGL